MQKVLAQQLLSVRMLTDYTAKQCTCSYRSMERSTCAPLTHPICHLPHCLYLHKNVTQTKVAPMDDAPAHVAPSKSLQCTSLQWMSLQQKDIHLSTLLIVFSVMLLHMWHHWNHFNTYHSNGCLSNRKTPIWVPCWLYSQWQSTLSCFVFLTLQSGILVLFISFAILWNTLQCVPVYLHCLCNT